MAGNKYLEYGSNGVAKEVRSIDVTTGAGDAGKIIATDASGKLDESFLPTGVGPDIAIIEASENLSAGDFVNLWDDGGTVKVRLADASNGFAYKCDGFVKDAFLSTENATVYFEGLNDSVSGLTAGLQYYLSTTVPGKVQTATPTAATGNIAQLIGKATQATELSFEQQAPIELES